MNLNSHKIMRSKPIYQQKIIDIKVIKHCTEFYCQSKGALLWLHIQSKNKTHRSL
ncbi:hypothetical protein VCHA50O413_10608 [Vibrio chagasii]|nr:hypothetical protein VCHA34P114_10306 [Vibrio chagasii]CAH6840087.1 hypothetical protein VCHA36P168_170058 [Vibrio chagasii]CAH6848129.1 hypothetical protein VCHA34P120_190069 [Vibrio chagasii]CAH6863308.1 hypothetical protein VCHA36P161_10609 [Vibrio chagasii]CAH6880777.1 hypothetical protein VCHA36O157_20207 [Vibrio chagasii]